MKSPLRRSLSRLRRSVCESLGHARYSRPALYELDRKLERHLDFDGGVFVEAGANDGFEQSNTYYFEKMRRWTGLLVEPVPELAAECRKNRAAPVVEAALVDRDVPGARVTLHLAGLMSTVAGAFGDDESTARHVRTGLEVQSLPPAPPISVPARTLSSLLDEAGLTKVDLLSLDIEGGELTAIRGLDCPRHAPRFVCVEARNPAAMVEALAPWYRLVEVLTELGTHQDLLFARR